MQHKAILLRVSVLQDHIVFVEMMHACKRIVMRSCPDSKMDVLSTCKILQLLLILRFVRTQLSLLCVYIITFQHVLCMHTNTIIFFLNEANAKRRRYIFCGVDGDKSFNPWSQRTNFQAGKVCTWRRYDYHRVYEIKSLKVKVFHSVEL